MSENWGLRGRFLKRALLQIVKKTKQAVDVELKIKETSEEKSFQTYVHSVSAGYYLQFSRKVFSVIYIPLPPPPHMPHNNPIEGTLDVSCRNNYILGLRNIS